MSDRSPTGKLRGRIMTALRPGLYLAAYSVTKIAVAGWRLVPVSVRLRRPIFMIGCPRSGTTIAAELFGRHPEVANYSEAGWIWDPRSYFDPEADHHWSAADVTPTDARRLHLHFELMRRLQRKPRFFNKHPRTSVRIDYVRAVFPDAVFIHVLRDGRAAAHSIAERRARERERHGVPMGNFCKPERWRELVREDWLEEAAWQWREIVESILARREELGDAYHEFKYEELCEDCPGTLRRALEFAGLDAGHQVLARYPATLRSQNGKWRASLTEQQVTTVKEIQAPLLRGLGYAL